MTRITLVSPHDGAICFTPKKEKRIFAEFCPLDASLAYNLSLLNIFFLDKLNETFFRPENAQF